MNGRDHHTNAARRATTPDKLRRSASRRSRHHCRQGAEEESAGTLRLGHSAGRRSSSVPQARTDQRPAGHARLSRRQVRAPEPHGSRARDPGRRGDRLLASWARGSRRRTARAQRDFALRQLSRAEAINDLNTFLLSDAAPSGKPFTVNDLLGRAEHIVERQPGNNTNRVDLLISIGRQYETQDEDAKARRVLEQAYKLSRGLRERSTRARASCALASTLARAGERQRAETLIQEGLRELPDQPQFMLDRVFCLLRGSEVARDRGAITGSDRASAECAAAIEELAIPIRGDGFAHIDGLGRVVPHGGPES